MDDTTATTPSPSSAATVAGYDAARDKTNADVAVNSNSVRLLIKSSNQQYDDMNFECELCWTVQRLKKHLSLVYPGKPATNDQKLIYSGKLLDDAQKLSEVIRSYKDVFQQHHIFHLVCATKNIIKPPHIIPVPPKDNKTTARQDATNTNDNELRSRHVGSAPATAGAQLLYQQQPPLQQSNIVHPWAQLMQQQNLLNQMATANSQSHLEMQQQAILYNAWIQQWYAMYMQQMMSRTNGTDNAIPSPPGPFPMMQNFPMIPNGFGVPLVGTQSMPVVGAAAAGAAQPNEAAVAQQPVGRQVNGPNFPNIQEEPEIRDWLDSFFSFTRLAIFITVLYFNSSPLRCLLVILIASVIYLYHIGVLRRRRERNNNNINRNNNAGNDAAAIAAVQQIQRMMDAAVEHDNNPQAAAEPVPVSAQNAAANDDDSAARVDEPASADADQANAAMASAEAVAVEPENANNSVISLVRTFVITFFTSLLPEAPAL